jgi:Rne/Rng family ribonuclease
MSKELVISATPHETRVAIMEDGQLCEIYIEREKEFALVGSLYKGRVTRVLPGMQSAFVDIGLDSDAFLYVSDFLEHLEDYDHVEPKQHAPAVRAPAVHAPAPRVEEVYPPTTVNGGVEHEHVEHAETVSEPAAADSEPPPASQPVESTSAPIITPLEGETFQVATAGQPASYDSSAPPMRSSRPPFEQRNDRDRGRGGFGNRGGRGGHGGSNRRFGRPDRGRGGRSNPRFGRDLPPAKYASPGESRPPRESQPYESAGSNFEPIILPGESLAKFKESAPSAHATPGIENASRSAPASSFQPPQRSFTDEELSAGLPGALFVSPSPAVSETLGEIAGEENLAPLAGTAERASGFAASSTETEAEPTASPESITANGSRLTEEDVTALAEQLTEAKHEEAQADAEERAEAIEAVAESYVEPAELEELQEALDSDQDEHEEAAEEADAIADEMHDEAMAAEAHGEAHGEIHEGEHLEAHEEEHGEMHEGEGDHSEAHEEGHEGEHAEPHAEDHEEFHDGADAMHAGQAGEGQPPSSARVSQPPRARFQRPVRRGGGGRPQRGGRRGGRPHQAPQHGHPRHEQHRRPQLISEMLKAGEEIIVQIAKEPLGKKGARITSHVALPGRFLVYMPTVDHIGVSRRIGSAEDRSRLRRLVNEAKGTFPGGFIVRTAAAGATDDEIRTDVEFLGRTWDTIRTTSEQRRAPSLLHRDLNLVERILRDYLSDDYAAIWLDNEEAFTKVVEFVGRFQPKMVPRVKLYTKEAPIFEEFGIQQELDKALRPKVWLKSGGYIVINHTEALVAIDVNTGKYVGRGSTRLEDTIVKTNLEAVKEIVRQIRLRDLGGIIVVDFIDMEERRNREKVLASLDQALNQDRAPSKALAFNEFGLVCITRKRTKQALERVLCQPCPYCTGSGMVKSIPTICYEITSEARKMSADLDAQSLTLRVNPEIAKSLKTRESSLVEELEQITRKSVIIQSDPTLHWEQYDIY